ncbi:LOW QUALITY PROTEIN: uncharacterized protein PAF06_005788 [Gastrophryne carolinensis]
MALKGIGGMRPAVPMAHVYLDWGTGRGLRQVGVSEDIPVNVLLGYDLGWMLCHYAPEDTACTPEGLGDSPDRSEVLYETLGDTVKYDNWEGVQEADKCLPVTEPVMSSKGEAGCNVKCNANELPMSKPSGDGQGRGVGVPLVTCKDEGPAVSDMSPSCEPEMAEEEGRSDVHVYDACNIVMSGTEGEEGKPQGGIPMVAVVTRQQCARAAAVKREDGDARGKLCDSQAKGEEGGDASSLEGNVPPDATRWGEGNEQFLEALRSDASLEGLRPRAEQAGANTDGHRVYWENNILYWESLSKSMLGPQERERQLVVPRQFRKELLRLAHEPPGRTFGSGQDKVQVGTQFLLASDQITKGQGSLSIRLTGPMSKERDRSSAAPFKGAAVLFSHFPSAKAIGNYQKRLNSFIRYKEFRMESYDQLRPAASLPAYYISAFTLQIPEICSASKPGALSLLVQGFTCLGLSTAPQIFIKILVEPMEHLIQEGITIIPYLDDLLLLSRSEESLLADLEKTLLRTLGWIVNLKKLNLVPSHCFRFLGYDLDRILQKILPL